MLRVALTGTIDVIAYCVACPIAAAFAITAMGVADPSLQEILLAPASRLETWVLASFATFVFALPASVLLVAWSEYRGRHGLLWYAALGAVAATATYAAIPAMNGALPRLPELAGTALGGFAGGLVFWAVRWLLNSLTGRLCSRINLTVARSPSE